MRQLCKSVQSVLDSNPTHRGGEIESWPLQCYNTVLFAMTLVQVNEITWHLSQLQNVQHRTTYSFLQPFQETRITLDGLHMDPDVFPGQTGDFLQCYSFLCRKTEKLSNTSTSPYKPLGPEYQSNTYTGIFTF